MVLNIKYLDLKGVLFGMHIAAVPGGHMKKQPILRLFFVIILYFVTLGINTGDVFGQAQGSTDLFLDADVEGRQLRNADSTVMRARFVKINFDTLSCEGDAGDAEGAALYVDLNLFADAYYNAVLEHKETNKRGADTWIGHIEGVEHSHVILVYKDGIMAGNISIPGEFYQVRSEDKDVFSIRQLDHSKFEACAAEEEHTPDVHAGHTHGTDAVLDDAAADDGSTIDVMVVYNQAARAGSGSTEAINIEIDLAVTETNQGYINSGVNQRLNLVHTAEVAYVESGSIYTDRNNLSGTSDGNMDEVHALRDTYAADLVVLITEGGGGYCGVAYIMTTVTTSFENYGFCVVKRSCATGYYSFGHELGHIMSARHDYYVDPSTNSPYTYNHGFVNVPDQWRTIMAYNNDCSDSGSYCTRIDYWSNPDVSYGGDAMGVAEGSPNAADNRKTLNNTAYTVANFRVSPQPEITVTSPNGGESIELGASQNITWSDAGLTGTLKISLLKDGVVVGTIASGVDPALDSYSWTVGDYIGGPAAAGTGYTVKIKEQGTTVVDVSDAPFTITAPASVTVTSPNGGENLELGTSGSISWDAVALTGNLKITLWKDGTTIGTIADNLDPAPGSYSWTVGDYDGGTASAGTGYQVKIKDLGSKVTDKSDSTFTISQPVSVSLTVTSPNGGESLQQGAVRNITWDSSGVSGTLKITLWKDGVFVGVVADGLDAASGTYAWTVGNYTGGTAAAGTGYTVKIKEKGTTVADVGDGSFSIVSLAITAPNGGEGWQIGSTQNITWSASGVSGLLKITLWKDGVVLGTVADNVTAASGSYSWTVGNHSGGTAGAGTGYAIKIKEKGTTVADFGDGSFSLTD